MDTKIKAILFDIDGSIMKQGGPAIPETGRIFRELRSAGLKVGPATGKNADYCRGLACGFGLSWDFISAETGAQFLVLLSDDPVAYKQKKAGLDCEDLAEFLRIIGYCQQRRTFKGPEGKVIEFRPELKEGIVTLFPPGTILEITEQWKDYFEKVVDVFALDLKIQRHSDGCIDVVPVTVSKTLGIRNVCSHLGIEPLNILTVVDGANDYELTQGSVRTIAVGNAQLPIKEAVAAKGQDGFQATGFYGQGFLEGLKHFARKEWFEERINTLILGL